MYEKPLECHISSGLYTSIRELRPNDNVTNVVTNVKRIESVIVKCA